MFRFRRKKNTEHRETPDTPIDIKRLLGYLKPYRLRLSIAIVALIASAALGLVFPAVIQQVVDSVLSAQDWQLLDQITLALIGVFLLTSITSIIETYNLNYIGERITFDLRLHLYTHLQHLSLSFFENRRVGELVSRLSSDVTVLRNALTNNIGIFIQQIITLFGAVTVMLIMNWRLTLFILALVPIIVAVAGVFAIFLRRASTQVQDELANATSIVDEVFQNIQIVKSFVRENYEISRYTNAITNALNAALKVLRIRAVFSPLVSFLGFGSLALILWFGGREVLEGRLTGGALIAFLVYGLTVAGSIGSIAAIYTQLQEAIGATRRVFELIDQTNTLPDKPDAKPVTNVEGRITFDNVHFSYEAGHEVLHNIDIDIAPGEILALVGPSGAGKSTIFSLIPRFYDPDSGAIKIDGLDLRDADQNSQRQHIGMVPQETLLFGGTIDENLRYGRLDASEDEVIAAAIAANAHEFITQLPDGYATIVGERGVRLSGGQRQRIAIARALLKNPRILLLDEATSSLDNESEHLVQEALARLMQNRTTVIIAHRLSTIRVASRIAVLDKGRIVELGSHDELLEKDGLYARLYTMQFQEDIVPDDPQIKIIDNIGSHPTTTEA